MNDPKALNRFNESNKETTSKLVFIVIVGFNKLLKVYNHRNSAENTNKINVSTEFSPKKSFKFNYSLFERKFKSFNTRNSINYYQNGNYF